MPGEVSWRWKLVHQIVHGSARLSLGDLEPSTWLRPHIGPRAWAFRTPARPKRRYSRVSTSRASFRRWTRRSRRLGDDRQGMGSATRSASGPVSARLGQVLGVRRRSHRSASQGFSIAEQTGAERQDGLTSKPYAGPDLFVARRRSDVHRRYRTSTGSNPCKRRCGSLPLEVEMRQAHSTPIPHQTDKRSHLRVRELSINASPVRTV